MLVDGVEFFCTFCLSVLSTLESGVLKSPTVFLDLSVSFLFFNVDCF